MGRYPLGEVMKYKYKGNEQEYQYEYRRNRLLKLFELKGGKCEHCDLRDLKHIEIYDYHHIDPNQKKFNIGSAISNRTQDEILKEAESCLLLCSNCHRIEHHRMSRVKRAKRSKELKEQNIQMSFNLEGTGL